MLLVGLVVFMLSILVGCSTQSGKASESNKGDKEETTTGKNKTASIKLNEGFYVVPDLGEASKDEKFLALNISIKNEMKKSLSITSGDIALYDKDENKIEPEILSSLSDGFKTLDFSSISAGKTLTGYVVFKIEPKKDYKLHFEPRSYEIESKDDADAEVVLTVDTKKYKDNTEEPVEAAKAFVNTIFFNKDDEKFTKLVSNNKETDQEEYKKELRKKIKDVFHYYQPTDEELDKVANEYMSANATSGEVTYEISTSYPDSAKVTIKSKLISFSDMNNQINEITKQFVSDNDANDDLDYKTKYIDAEKYLLEHFSEVFSNTPASDPRYSTDEEISLTKSEGKWEIKSANTSKNYEYQTILRRFAGQ